MISITKTPKAKTYQLTSFKCLIGLTVLCTANLYAATPNLPTGYNAPTGTAQNFMGELMNVSNPADSGYSGDRGDYNNPSAACATDEDSSDDNSASCGTNLYSLDPTTNSFATNFNEIQVTANINIINNLTTPVVVSCTLVGLYANSAAKEGSSCSINSQTTIYPNGGTKEITFKSSSLNSYFHVVATNGGHDSAAQPYYDPTVAINSTQGVLINIATNNTITSMPFIFSNYSVPFYEGSDNQNITYFYDLGENMPIPAFIDYAGERRLYYSRTMGIFKSFTYSLEQGQARTYCITNSWAPPTTKTNTNYLTNNGIYVDQQTVTINPKPASGTC